MTDTIAARWPHDEAERLRRFDLLEEALKAQKDEGHDGLYMGTWAASITPFGFPEISKRHPCGTVACALGTLALYPPAQELGLRLRGYDQNRQEVKDIRTVDELRHTGGGECVVHFGQWLTGYEAGRYFLGISYEEAQYLFSPGCYAYVEGFGRDTPINTVLDHVREVRRKYEVDR